MANTVLVLAVLAAVCVSLSHALVASRRLNAHIAHYEPLDVDLSSVFRHVERRELHANDFDVDINAFQRTFRLKMTRIDDLFTSDVTFESIEEDGSKRTYPLSDVAYYRGHVEGHNNTYAHLSVRKTGHIRGKFVMNSEQESYEIHPAHAFFREEQSFDHLAVRSSDYDWKPTDTALDFIQKAKAEPTLQTQSQQDPSLQAHSRARRGPYVATLNTCQIALVADYRLWNTRFGGAGTVNSDALTQDFMVEHLDFAAAKFAATDFSGITAAPSTPQIRLQTKTIQILKNTNLAINKAAAVTSGEQYLTTFSKTDWSSYCLAHIFTYQDFAGGLLGLAWVGSASPSTPGGICQGPTGSVSDRSYTNTGFTTGINYGSEVPSLMGSIVTTHEFGHNFGSNHDDANVIPTDGVFIMYPSAADGSDTNNDKFSSSSKSQIAAVVNAKGGCFVAYSQQTCGNGVQEDTDGLDPLGFDEDCDCGGDASTCTSDPCCNAFSPGSSDNCKINTGAGYTCSPFHQEDGVCCNPSTCKAFTSTVTCRKEEECKLAAECSGTTCPAAVNKQNDITCQENSFLCSAGECSKSVCELFTGWETPCVFDTGADACEIECCEDGSACDSATTCRKITDPVVSANYNNNVQGGPYTASDFHYKATAAFCAFTSNNGEPLPESGSCSASNVCEEVKGEETNLDKLKNLAKDLWNNENVQAAVKWLKEDGPLGIKNWQWILIGGILLLIVLTITGSCFTKKRTNRVTNKRAGAI